jgi:glutathione-independent formaldehyde dehydrogenase
MQYNRALMQAILWDRIKITDIAGVKVISRDEAPAGYAQVDAGAPTKIVIDPHNQRSG